MIKPEDAKFRNEKELIIENLDLVNIITPFIADESNDKENSVKKYDHKELPKISQELYYCKELDPLDTEPIREWEAVISSFRGYLEEKSSDGRSIGEEILKSNVELHDILYKLKLYNHDEKIDENIRRYASHYYSYLADQGREKAIDMLSFESTIENSKKETKKGGKNKKKSKRRNNRNKDK